MRLLLLAVTCAAPLAFADETPRPVLTGPSASNPQLNADFGLQMRLIDNHIQLLELSRQSIVPPTIVVAIGGVGLLTGFALIPGYYYSPGVPLAVLGISVVPVAAGIALLVLALSHNTRIDVLIEQQRLERSMLNSTGISDARRPELAAPLAWR